VKHITWQPEALKALRKISANTSKRIVSKIEAYARNPASQANKVKALKGKDAVRLRCGNWPVIMRDKEVLEILRIGPRSSVYERL